MILVITMTESLSQIWSWIDARARSYADGVESRKKPSPEIDDFKKKKKTFSRRIPWCILFQETDQYKIVIKKNLLLSRLGEVQGPFTWHYYNNYSPQNPDKQILRIV